jgi:hypothetical protein
LPIKKENRRDRNADTGTITETLKEVKGTKDLENICQAMVLIEVKKWQ